MTREEALAPPPVPGIPTPEEVEAVAAETREVYARLLEIQQEQQRLADEAADLAPRVQSRMAYTASLDRLALRWQAVARQVAANGGRVGFSTGPVIVTGSAPRGVRLLSDEEVGAALDAIHRARMRLQCP